MLARPVFGKIRQIEVFLPASAPIKGHRTLLVLGNGVFDDGLDRCEACPSGNQQHRFS